MPSAAYTVFREAILHEKPVTYLYKGHRRELCPVVLGHSGREEKLLAFQFGGTSNSRLPPGGQWRCLDVTQVSDARLSDGPWREGLQHRVEQTCVHVVDLDVNVDVRHRR
jgi:hypothetical protein